MSALPDRKHALQIAAAPLEVRQVAAPPDGWLDIKAVAAEMDGRSQSAREKKAVRLAGRLARSSDPKEHTCVVKVGRCYYIDPRAEYKDETLAERRRKRNHDSIEVVFPTPDGIEDELREWTPKDWLRFKLGWKVIYAWERICDGFKHKDAQFRLRALHEECAGHFEKLGMKPPSLRTIRLWKNEKLNPKHANWTGLRDGRGRRSHDDAFADFYELFKRFWLDKRQPAARVSYRDAAQLATRRNIAVPCYRTLCRYIDRELPPHISDFYRKGEKYWEANHEPFIERNPENLLVNEVWVGDCKRLDCITDEYGRARRVVLAVFMDKRTRVIVGWAIGTTENSSLILAAFRMAAREYGLPNRLYIDNGKAYIKAVGGRKKPADELTKDERRIDNAIGDLCRIIYARAYNAKAKGDVERWFRTFAEQCEKRIPSYCGGSPDQRPEDFYKDLKRRRIPIPTTDDFRISCGNFIALYNRTEHSGAAMRERTPLDVFAQEDAIPKRTAPTNILEAMLKRVETVKVTRRGITIDKIVYTSDSTAFFALVGKTVQVRIDDDDLSQVDVIREGAFVCHAKNTRLIGTNKEHLREGNRRKKSARRKVREAGAARRDAWRSAEDHARSVRDEQLIKAHEQQQKAVGDDRPHRPLKLIPGADAVEQTLPKSRSQTDWTQSDKDALHAYCSDKNAARDRAAQEQENAALMGDEDDVRHMGMDDLQFDHPAPAPSELDGVEMGDFDLGGNVSGDAAPTDTVIQMADDPQTASEFFQSMSDAHRRNASDNREEDHDAE